MSDPMGNFVTAAYNPVIEAQLKGIGRWNELFPLTPEQRERYEQARRAEQDRRVNLMKDHMTTSGTTDVCRCGHVGYSTPGYFLHLYDVIAADVNPEYDD